MNEFLKHRRILTISTLVFVLLVVAAIVLSLNLTSSSDNNSKTIKGIEQRLDAAVKSGRITQEEAHARQRQITSGKSRNGTNRKPAISSEGIVIQLNTTEERLNAAVENGKLTQEEANAKREQLNAKREEFTAKRNQIAQEIDQRLNTAVESGKLTQEEADAKREQLANDKLPNEHRNNQGQIAKRNNPNNCCQKTGGGKPYLRSDDGKQKMDRGVRGRKYDAQDRRTKGRGMKNPKRPTR
jgi:hypothetical protein